MPDYKINLEDKFGSLRLIDVGVRDASRGVARVVSDLSVLCPRAVDEGDNRRAFSRQVWPLRRQSAAISNPPKKGCSISQPMRAETNSA